MRGVGLSLGRYCQEMNWLSWGRTFAGESLWIFPLGPVSFSGGLSFVLLPGKYIYPSTQLLRAETGSVLGKQDFHRSAWVLAWHLAPPLQGPLAESGASLVQVL